VRNERWRYIRYADGFEELYDHASDPDERHNLAREPALTAEKTRLGALCTTDMEWLRAQ
jgi:iduronate 2-sulfatase